MSVFSKFMVQEKSQITRGIVILSLEIQQIPTKALSNRSLGAEMNRPVHSSTAQIMKFYLELTQHNVRTYDIFQAMPPSEGTFIILEVSLLAIGLPFKNGKQCPEKEKLKLVFISL